MSAAAVESAIKAIDTHPQPELATGLAEGLAIAYFTSQVITGDQFKEFCARIRDIGLRFRSFKNGN